MFLILGVAAVIAAFIGGIPKYFVVPSQNKWALVIVGAAMSFIAGYILWYDKYRQPKIELIDYGIKINFPTEGNTAKSPITAGGTFVIQPKNDNIYTVEFNPILNLYWPKGRAVFNPNTKTWNATLSIGGGDYKQRRLIIAELTPVGMAFLNYYRQVSSPGSHKGIADFNLAMRVLDQVNIILEA